MSSNSSCILEVITKLWALHLPVITYDGRARKWKRKCWEEFSAALLPLCNMYPGLVSSKLNSLLPAMYLFAPLGGPSSPCISYKQHYSPVLACSSTPKVTLLPTPLHGGGLACQPSTVLQILSHTERCTSGGWVLLLAYGILYCCLLEDTANTVLLALLHCTEFFIWCLACCSILMQHQRDGIFRKTVPTLHRISLYMFTITASK